MKLKILLVIILFGFIGKAQTNTWTGGALNGDWLNPLNWSLGHIPTSTENAVIPTNFYVFINGSVSVKTLKIKGNSTFSLSGTLSVSESADFGPSTTTTWTSGFLTGGGVIVNNGSMTVSADGNKNLVENTTLKNTGVLNYSKGSWYIYGGGILLNDVTGTINVAAVDPYFKPYGSTPGEIINNGTLVKQGEGSTQVAVKLTNNGTINVQAGSFYFNNQNIVFDTGIINITSGADLFLDQATTLSGNLTGEINGILYIDGDIIIPTGETASFNFSGESSVLFQTGIISGGGTLTNYSKLSLVTGNSKSLSQNTTLNNQGIINYESGSWYIYDNGKLINSDNGIINVAAVNPYFRPYGAPGEIINNGTLRKIGAGSTQVAVKLTNNGTINVQEGSFYFNNDNIVFNSGIYNISEGADLTLAATVTFNGTLTGEVNGSIFWNGIIVAPANQTAILDFTGSGGVFWRIGTMTGGGTLRNLSHFSLITGDSKNLIGGTTLENREVINYESGSWYIYDNGKLINSDSGIINVAADGPYFKPYGAPGEIINNGTLRKIGEGSTQVAVKLTNNGTINVQQGSFYFNNDNIVFNSGIYNISEGADLTLAATVTFNGTLTGEVNGSIFWNGIIVAPANQTAILDFTGSGGVFWRIGTITGGGTLRNLSHLSLITGDSKNLIGGTTLENREVINYESGSWYIYDNATLLNFQGGLIKVAGVVPYFKPYGAPGEIINNGTLRKIGEGSTQIAVKLINNGTINVQKGNFYINNEDTLFNSGIYTISNEASLQLVATVTLDGILTGEVNGSIFWDGVIKILENHTATLDFTGSGGVFWRTGTLTGSGLLKNLSKFSMITSGQKTLNQSTIFENQGTINYEDGSWYIYGNAIFLNGEEGTIEVASTNPYFRPYGSTPGEIINNGIFIKNAGGNTQDNVKTTNNGTMKIEGELYVPAIFSNTVTGVIEGTGTFTISDPNNFSNSGMFAPGNSPGKLTFSGNFKSENSSSIEIEINGHTPIEQYDFFQINGNSDFKGTVRVILGTALEVGDTFTVANTTGTVQNCGLEPTAATSFGGFDYVFSIGCVEKNVVLTVTQKTVTPEYTISTSSAPAIGGTTSGGGTFYFGELVSLTATANNGYIFLNWQENGNIVSTDSNYVFEATADRTLVAKFKIVGGGESYTITTVSAPVVGGTTTGGGVYNSGSTATVKATAATGYLFESWMQGTTVVATTKNYSFTVEANRTLKAKFVKKSFTITTVSSPAAGGTTTGSGTYFYGKNLTVKAIAAPGYLFESWMQGTTVVSTDKNYNFTVEANRTLKAKFVLNGNNRINASANLAEAGDVTGSGDYRLGDLASLNVFTKPGYLFVGWMENGEIVSTNSEYNFTVNGNRDLNAYFEKSNVSGQTEVKIQVYPNPFTDFVWLDSGSSKIQNIQLYDLSGRLVHQQSVNQLSKYQLDTRAILKGNYLLIINTNSGSKTVKVYKK